jgi:hypothetical protein
MPSTARAVLSQPAVSRNHLIAPFRGGFCRFVEFILFRISDGDGKGIDRRQAAEKSASREDAKVEK